MPCRTDLPDRLRARRRARVARRRTLAATLATALALGACGRPAPPVQPDRTTAAGQTARAVAVAVVDTPADQDPYSRWLAHALLVPLLDDAEPPRWREPGPWAECDPATRVLLDGEPLPIGAPLPDRPFTLHWRAVACLPMGGQGPMLDADATLRVERVAPDTWVLQVDARRIAWQGGDGRRVHRSGSFEVRMPQHTGASHRLQARARAVDLHRP